MSYTRLAIIPVDGAVHVDNINLTHLDLSTCGVPDNIHALQWVNGSGWIELKGTFENILISELPDWAHACKQKFDEAYNLELNPPVIPPSALDNKSTATGKLYDTDWAMVPDVSDPTKADPYLTNVADFLAYRNAVRQYVVNPVEGYIQWPIKPVAVWSNTSQPGA